MNYDWICPKYDWISTKNEMICPKYDRIYPYYYWICLIYMTEFVLNKTGCDQIMIGFEINVTRFVKKMWLFFVVVNLAMFVLNMTGFVLNMTWFS